MNNNTHSVMAYMDKLPPELRAKMMDQCPRHEWASSTIIKIDELGRYVGGVVAIPMDDGANELECTTSMLFWARQVYALATAITCMVELEALTKHFPYNPDLATC